MNTSTSAALVCKTWSNLMRAGKVRSGSGSNDSKWTVFMCLIWDRLDQVVCQRAVEQVRLLLLSFQACAGLNGMQLGDKKLVVQRASVGKNPGGAVCLSFYLFFSFWLIHGFLGVVGWWTLFALRCYDSWLGVANIVRPLSYLYSISLKWNNLWLSQSLWCGLVHWPVSRLIDD